MVPTLVGIPGSWFLMGSDAGQDCERPIHPVWVNAFQLAATQVTNAQYGEFLRATATLPPPFWTDPNFSHPEQPVTGVSWHEATRYCEWLSSETARQFRLPTEAEWEFAARGGLEQKQFPWGDEPPQSLPDYATRWQTGPEPVARYAPSAFGLVRHWRQRPRMVQRLVRSKLLRDLARSQPPRTGTKSVETSAQSFSRRIMAPPHQGCSLLRAFEHPPAISVC